MKSANLLLSGALCAAFYQPALAGEIMGWDVSGNIALEARIFTEDALYAGQSQESNLSLSFEPEWTKDFMDGDMTVTFKPFVRVDQHDDERSHRDLREFFALYFSGDWEWRAGINTVFWGVTESQHLVDIINQTDGVENVDGEQKLGQPMLHATWYQDWGVLEAFVLPMFRERTYPGEEGRLRGELVVDTDQARYATDDDDSHIDGALRWSHSLGVWDLGLSYFTGTAREPDLSVGEDAQGKSVLVPYYPYQQQVGLDAQATLEAWLWKIEAVNRKRDSKHSSAAVGGFEYTFVGIMDSDADLGLLMEYHLDSRGVSEPGVAFQRDVFFGGRYVLNDAQSSEALMGVFYDVDYDSLSFRAEAERRIGAAWKVRLEAQLFDADDDRDVFYGLRQDDFVQLNVARYF